MDYFAPPGPRVLAEQFDLSLRIRHLPLRLVSSYILEVAGVHGEDVIKCVEVAFIDLRDDIRVN